MQRLGISKKKGRMIETNRIIERRWKILMSWMYPMGGETKEEAESKQILTKGYLKKYNLRCGCSSCKYDKYRYKREKIKINELI